MLTEVQIAPKQFEGLLSVLTSNDRRFALIVDNANAEVLARVRSDNEIRTELAGLTTEVGAIRKALMQLLEALDAESRA